MSKADEPTVIEEQVTAANAAEEAKWQGDFPEENLTIPYKREENADSGKPKVTDEPKDDAPGDEEETPEVAAYTDPEPVVTVQDPGEYKPGDYSFEVVLKDGKTKKVNTPDEAEALADDPDNFETPKQLMEFINKQNRMNTKLDKEKDDYDRARKTFDEQTATEEERQQTVNNFANEMLYLIDKGLIPDIEDKTAKQRWLTDENASKDAEFIKTPGVKEQIELLDYLVKENQRRSKAGVQQLMSLIDAHNGWQLEENNKQEKDEAKAAGEARKAASARVASSSPTQQGSYVPKGIAVGNPNILKRGAAVWDD